MNPSTPSSDLLKSIGALIYNSTVTQPTQPTYTPPPPKNCDHNGRELDPIVNSVKQPKYQSQINYDVVQWLGHATPTPEGHHFAQSLRLEGISRKNDKSGSLEIQIFSKNANSAQGNVPIVLSNRSENVQLKDIPLPATMWDARGKNVQEWFAKEAKKLNTEGQIPELVTKKTVGAAVLPVSADSKKSHFVPTVTPDSGEMYLLFSWNDTGVQSSALKFKFSGNQFPIQGDGPKGEGQYDWSAEALTWKFDQDLHVQQAEIAKTIDLNGMHVLLVRFEEKEVQQQPQPRPFQSFGGGGFSSGWNTSSSTTRGGSHPKSVDMGNEASMTAVMGEGAHNRNTYSSTSVGKIVFPQNCAAYFKFIPITVELSDHDRNEQGLKRLSSKFEALVDEKLSQLEKESFKKPVSSAPVYNPSFVTQSAQGSFEERMFEKVHLPKRWLTLAPNTLFVHNTPVFDFTKQLTVDEAGRAYFKGKVITTIINSEQPVMVDLGYDTYNENIEAHMPTFVCKSLAGGYFKIFVYDPKEQHYNVAAIAMDNPCITYMSARYSSKLNELQENISDQRPEFN